MMDMRINTVKITTNDDFAQGGQTGLWRLLLEVDETES